MDNLIPFFFYSVYSYADPNALLIILQLMYEEFCDPVLFSERGNSCWLHISLLWYLFKFKKIYSVSFY